MNKHHLTKDARTNLGAAQPAPGSQRRGEDEATHGGTEGASPGVEGAAVPPSCAGDQTGAAKVPSGAEHRRWKQGMERHLPVLLPICPASCLGLSYVPLKHTWMLVQRWPHQGNSARAPSETRCAAGFELHHFVPLFVRLAGTRHKALHPATFSARPQLGKAGAGAQPRSPFSSLSKRKSWSSASLSSLSKRKPPAPIAFWGWQVLNMLGTAQYFWLAGIAQRGL